MALRESAGGTWSALGRLREFRCNCNHTLFQILC